MAKKIKKTFSGIFLPKIDMNEMVYLAKMAEKYRLDYFWVCDEAASYPFRDPFVTLGQMASATKKIVLGTSITNPYTRHPVLTAAAFATLDEASDGRVALGLGPGGSLSLPPLGYKLWDEPLKWMREATVLFRKLFRGETVQYEGEKLKALGARMFRSREIPIYYGIRGPGMLKLAGELADGVHILTPKGYLEAALDLMAEGAEKAGRSLGDVDVGGSGTFYVSRDEAEARESAKYPLTWVIPDSPPLILESVGISKRDAEEISKARRTGGVEAAMKLITEDMLDAMTISGTPDQCARKVVEKFRKGVTQYMFSPPWGKTERMGLKLIGEEVIPKVKAMIN